MARSPIRLPAARSRAVGLVLGSDLLLCGGLTAGGATTGSILRIDVASGRISTAGSLAVAVHDAGAAVFAGSGYVVGGGSAVAGTAVQRIDSAGAASLAGRLPAARADLSAISVDGELLIVGGGVPGQPDGRILATTDGSHFRVLGRLSVAVRYSAVAVFGGLVYVVGGSTTSGETSAIQVLDPATGAVRIAGHLPSALSDAAALVVGGDMLIAGGRFGGRVQDELWRLDGGGATTTLFGRLPYPVADSAAVVSGRVGYLIGGETTGPIASIITVSTP